MQPDAPFRQLHRECRRMRTLLGATLNRFVRNEPSIAATAPVFSFRVPPASDVPFVGVRNAEREPINRRPAFRREMEDIFVAIVEITRRADRFEVTPRSR